MKQTTFYLVIGYFLGFSSPLLAQNQSDEDDAPATAQKAVYLEILGQGLLPSLNFDTRFSKQPGGLGGRIGVSYINFFGLSVSTIPVSLNYLKPLSRSGNYLEIGGGATFLGASLWGFRGGTAVGTLDFGYRYQPVNEGINFRACITPLFTQETFTPYFAGISLGYTFGKSRKPQARKPESTIKKQPKGEVAIKKPEQEWVKMADESYNLDNVYFDQGQSKLLTESYAQLDKLVSMLKNNRNMTIRVEGHTEKIGDEDANIILSEDRAIAVREYLKSKGVSASRVSVKGYGSSRPVSTGTSADDRRQNRRVTFMILSQ